MTIDEFKKEYRVNEAEVELQRPEFESYVRDYRKNQVKKHLNKLTQMFPKFDLPISSQVAATV